MTTVVGVDGFRSRWVVVRLDDGTVEDVTVCDDIREVVTTDAAIIGIDIPIGLSRDGVRRADIETRALVGPRRASVFMTPPRGVIDAPTYADARRIARTRHDVGVTAQAYALRSKILEVDTVATTEKRLREVHPEATFRMLAGDPLAYAKRTWNGQMERRRLLAGVGVVLPDSLGEAGRAPVDDILDAAACAWTAQRCALGEAVRLPSVPERDDRGVDMAVWM